MSGWWMLFSSGWASLSNITLWTKEVTKHPGFHNAENVEAVIELLAEANRESS